ncbi:MAG: NPCBM/NEW2 domain-containing protein [Eubacteriales bacterium]|nr:NPCBM/NEW2 domain-containing protein [Eubacteriales bacterium]
MKKKKVYAVGAAVFVLIVLAVLFLRPKGMSIVPGDYVKVSCSGLNGEGKARMYFDAQSFLAAIKEEKDLKPAQESEIQGMLAAADQYFELSETEELSNGDEILIESSMPSDLFKPYKIKIKNSDVEYTVAGLTERQTLNLTEYGVTEFKGFEGHGYVNAYIDYEKLYDAAAEIVKAVEDSERTEQYIANELYSDISRCVDSVTASKYEELSNGDEITVTYSVNEEQDRIEEYGIVFQGGEAELEAEGLEDVETIELEDYLSAKTEGYDGAGELNVFIDYEKLSEDLLEKDLDERNGLALENVISQIESYVSYNFNLFGEKTSGISNGDEIHIFAQASEAGSYVDSVGFVLENAEKTITAEGLKEPQEIDVMDLLNVSFSGICPFVEVTAELDTEHPVYAYIDAESYDQIPYRISAQNGDTLDITLEYNEQEALKAGYKIINNEKSYEISGLDTYNFTLESVDAENLQPVEAAMKEQVNPILLDREYDLLENLSEDNGLILWNKVKSGLNRIAKVYAEHPAYNGNKAAFVYEATVPVMSQNETVTEHTVYVAFFFVDVIETADGTISMTQYNLDDIGIFYSEEKLEEAITIMGDSLETQEGTTSETTTVMNETLKEALKTESIEAAQEETQGQNVSDATPAVSTAVIPEISKEAQDSAAAMIEYDGHRYYRFDSAVTWKEAKELCEKAGGSLVSITSWTEQSVVQSLIEDGTMNQYWIGADDEALEGQWKWETGEAFTYDGWDQNQPDNYEGAEDYACISRTYGGSWNDTANEEEETGYILEVWDQQMETGEYLAESDTLIHEDNVSYDIYDDDSYGNRSYGVLAYNASGNGWTQYRLDGAYEKLTGETAVYADAESGVSIDFAIFGDGELLYRQSSVTRQSVPTSFNIDVSGVQVLTIAARNMGDYSDGYLLLNKAKLYETEKKEARERRDRIQDLQMIDQAEYVHEITLWQDTTGKLHDGYGSFNASADSFASWNLDGEYETFSGKFVLSADTGSDISLKVQIYGDDELLFESSGYDKTKDTLEFSVDVTGKEVLKIVTDNEKESSNAYIYLADEALSAPAEENAQTEANGQTEAEVTAWDLPDSENVPEKNGYTFPEVSQSASSQAAAFEEYDSHRYYLFDTPMTWEKAKQFCEQAGGHLAVITSPQEQRRIEKLIEKGNESEYWIGGSDTEQNGNFKWVSGESVTYSNWKDGEPNASEKGEGIKEKYVEIYSGNGQWNDNDETMEIGFILEISNDKDTVKTYQELGEMDEKIIAGEGYEYQEQIADCHGNEYLSTYVLDASGNGWVTYDLDGAYTQISGILSTYQDTDQNADMNIGFFGDGKLLYQVTDISGWEKAISFTVDVTGVKTLTIKTSNTGEYSYGWLLLNDTILENAETPKINGAAGRLAEQQLVDSDGMEYEAGLFQDSYGNVYDGAYCLDSSDNGFALYLLDGKYTEFSGVICTGIKTQSAGKVKVEIYADDELVFEQDGITKMTEAIPFTLDVTGKKNLKITVVNADEENENSVYIAGDILK